MSAYNFQAQFAPLIKNGKKRSTIRLRRANGYLPKPGEKIRLYVGMRTRSCQRLREVQVTNVRPICIDTTEALRVILDGNQLRGAELADLARQEGFTSVEEMRLFFAVKYKQRAISAWLIEW